MVWREEEIEEGNKKYLKDFDSRLTHLREQLEAKEAELNRFEAKLQGREKRLNRQGHEIGDAHQALLHREIVVASKEGKKQ